MFNDPLPKHGFGLFSIRERLHYFDGSLEIQSKPGKGTKVDLVVGLKGKKKTKKGKVR